MENRAKGRQFKGVGLALDAATVQAIDALATARRQTRSAAAREVIRVGLAQLDPPGQPRDGQRAAGGGRDG